MRKLLLGCLVVLLGASLAWAQGVVPVQQSPSELRASTVCVDTRTVSGAATVTAPAVAGQSFYLNSVEVNAFATGGAVGTLSPPPHVASTGLVGSPTFGAIVGTAAAPANGTTIANFFYALSGLAIKGQASTAVTLTAPSVTNVGYHLGICGYYAP